MGGAQQVGSGNFPLGESAKEAVVGHLRSAFREARTFLGRPSRPDGRPDSVLLAPQPSPDLCVSFPGGKSASQVPVVLRLWLGRRHELTVLLLAELDRSSPAASNRFRRLLPALPWPPIEDPAASDEALLIMAEFEALEAAKQTATARNVALLWDCFVEEFGGVSGFLVATATERQEYLENWMPPPSAWRPVVFPQPDTTMSASS